MKSVHAMAVFAAFAVMLAPAPGRAQTLGPVDRSVPGVDLGYHAGVHREVGQREQTPDESSLGKNKRGSANSASSSWAPVRSGAEATRSPSRSGMQLGEEGKPGQELSPQEQPPLSPQEQPPFMAAPQEHKTAAKREAGKPTQSASGAADSGGRGTTGLESPFESGKPSFAFTGKIYAPSGPEEQKKADAMFAKETQARGPGGTFKRKKRRHIVPKTVQKPRGEENCDQASKLHLCTWL